MNIDQVMTRDIHIVSPEDSLHDAAQIMKSQDFDMLPVSENERLVGMVTDRDITVRAVARGLAPDDCKVRDVMSFDLKFLYEDESLEEAARSLSELQVRRLPVLNREQRMTGIISLSDLALHPHHAREKKRAEH